MQIRRIESSFDRIWHPYNNNTREFNHFRASLSVTSLLPSSCVGLRPHMVYSAVQYKQRNNAHYFFNIVIVIKLVVSVRLHWFSYNGSFSPGEKRK